MRPVDEALLPLRIGPVRIGFPVVLASLAGYSDLPYRRLCRGLGAPYCTTEAMLDKQMLVDGRLRKRLVRIDEFDHPVAGQIMGSDPAAMAAAAAVVRDMGFDVVDINFACPVRKVLARKRGGYLMDHPELALDIVRAVLEAVPDRPVTVKLRRSFREADRDGAAFRRITAGAFEAGTAAVCVHARAVDQKYRGRADWSFLAGVRREFPGRTIIGSGDVLTAADALRMLAETGVDGVSAARGAIGNPWFFRQARDLAAGRPPFRPSVDDQRETIERHHALACEVYGPDRALKVMRNFGIYYARMHPRPSRVRAAVLAVRNERDWREFLDAYYGEKRVLP